MDQNKMLTGLILGRLNPPTTAPFGPGGAARATLGRAARSRTTAMATRAIPLCPCRLRPMPFCSESSNGCDSLSERWRRMNERMKFESAVRRVLQKVSEKGRLKDKMKCDGMAGQVLNNLADRKIPFPELNHRPLLENGDEARCERNGEDAVESGIEHYDKKISSGGERVEEDNENLLKLASIYDKVLVVENVAVTREVVWMITTKYRDLIYACDTEVARIDVKREPPIDHGEIICFSMYPGSETDFGDDKSCIWVDVLDGGKDVLMEFSPFFENSTIKKER